MQYLCLMCRWALKLAVAFLFVLPVSSQDWPGFLGPDRDGVVKDGKLLTDWPEGGPRVLWSHDVGPGFGGAAIRDGKVYLIDRNDIVGDVLRVYDLSTGAPAWTCEYDAPGRINYHGSRSTPSVTETHAYTVGSFGHITCFDLKTQKVAWQKHMDDFAADPPKWGWSQSPLIVGDLLIIAPMAKDAGLVALKQDTGEIAWKSSEIGTEGYGSPKLMNLADQQQIVFLCYNRVTGTDPATGKVLWSYDGIPTNRGIPTPTDLGNNRIFITTGYDAGSALIDIQKQGDTFTAKEITRDLEHGGQVHAALLVGGHLYANLNTNENLAARKQAHGLGCFDLNGKLLWKNNNTPNIDRGALLAVGDHLLTLGGEDGVLRLIKADPTGYKELKAAKVFEANEKRNMIWGPMSFADGLLLVRSQNQIKCLDLRVRQAGR